MKKLSYLIVLALIFGLVLTGCFLSNVGQVPTNEQSGISYLTKGPNSVLVARWKFDEESGATAVADNSENSNTGIIYEAIPGVVGQFGNALSLDGTGDYVQIANESNFDFEKTDVLTLEAWVKTSSNACLNIITKMQNAKPNTGYQLIKHDIIRDNVLYFFLINDYDTGNMIRAYGSTNIADGQWHHVAVTYDGSSDVSGVQIYVDGNAETMGSTENGLTGSILNDLSLQISGREGSYYAFSGLIDEVRIWNEALTASQLDDMLPPEILITTPAEGDIYLLSQVVNASWTVSDGTGTGDGSGITGVDSATITATEAHGSPIDTNSTGSHDFTVAATDYAKNTDTKTVTYNVISPSIEIVKTASTTAAAPGDTVTYTYDVTNTGDVPLSDVTVSDDKAGDVVDFSGDTNSDKILDPGEAWIFTAEYIILEGDPEYLCNTAIVKGWYGEGVEEWVSDTSDEVCVHTMGARSIGYWKNHTDEDDWCPLPRGSMFFGVGTSTLLEYFPGNGIEEDGVNPLEMLRVQLLAAELNYACFEDDFHYARYEAADIFGTMRDAESLLQRVYGAAGHEDLNAYWSTLSKQQQNNVKGIANPLKDTLEEFNAMGDEIFE